MSGLASRHEMPLDFAAVDRFIESRGWTDGLPVVPPTEDLVAAMLAKTRRKPGEVLGYMNPLRGAVTVEKVAANAVMAGCYPEYFPVVMAAVKATLQEQYHAGSAACTTGGAAPAVMVSGPIAEKLGINSGTACFGGGYRANASIGRAVRLVMRNLGGAKAGGEEKSTQAWPGKMTFCFAENEARSPWEPLRVEQGYSLEQNTVTSTAVRGIYPVCEGSQVMGMGILETIVSSMRVVGSPIYTQGSVHDIPVVVVLGPEHATELAAIGFTKQSLKEYFFEHARMPVRALENRMLVGTDLWPDSIDPSNPDAMVPMVRSPDRFIVLVAGGDGRHSAWFPSWNVCQGAIELIEEAP